MAMTTSVVLVVAAAPEVGLKLLMAAILNLVARAVDAAMPGKERKPFSMVI
ncbi:hypothetical protein A2U01_0067844, partial [Trifolium medium]|nr:hypothetical protein [Trifolium medium]